MTEAAILAHCAAGAISPEIAVARMLLAGLMPDPERLRRSAAEQDAPALAAMADLAERHRDRLPVLRNLAGSGLTPEGDDLVAATARLFDRLAVEAPEAAVAFYSLGDAQALAAATAELADVVRAWAPPAGRRVLDFGCGIGRLAIALADEAAMVLGLDLSAGMIEQARRRAGGHPALRFVVGGGRDLAPAATGAIDLLIAADSLPFVVRAGATAGFMAEAARVLAPGGDLLVFNWSYRGDPDEDRREAEELAARFGFALLRAGERPFRIWDGSGFHLRRRP